MQRTSFAKCLSRFSGVRDFNLVEEFINAISIFKKIENISDDDAIEGLGLLLTGQASTWWQGVKSEAKTWTSAINLIRESFAPKKQPHEIYLELFSTRQGFKESIDTFLCTKRALLSQLPTQRHKEEDQIDLIYGLLNIYLKKHIPRSEIKTFRDLLTKGRHFQNLKNNEEGEISITKRCNYCKKRGHMEDECRKKQFNENKTKNMEKPGVKCYGCGTPGVYRSNCLNCKSQETPPKPVQFYSIIKKTIEDGVKIPIIEVKIKNSNGYAYLDSAARTSIAGSTLYELLLKEGYTFREKEAIINLADGSTKQMKLKEITIEMNIGNRCLPITLSAMPEGKNTRTLLGIDFLESAGIVLNLPQRSWYFIDAPETIFPFLQLKNTPALTINNSQSVKKLDFTNNITNESPTDFFKWFNEMKMLSPIPDTPPYVKDELKTSPVDKQEWKLKRLNTPPPISRPREPRAENETLKHKDPRVV
ncbi:uncharacterized protein LOC123690076 [Pieris rapae]|uniref:uncharacterized protein LOC123690076 n=1 Tax=Pieris rapae TaxID=64459 RepID=UPI001E27FED8|nr:uncharacterized protein LOC123690076 [Pieris rapae]